MSDAVETLVELMRPELVDGILYKCFCQEFGLCDLTTDELWELFDVRWAALSEVRFDKGLEAFLMRDDTDGAPSTVQLAALDPAGHVIGGLRIHVAPIRLLGDVEGVQISRVGVAWIARGAGIGRALVSKALHIGKALGRVKERTLVFLLGRVLDTDNPNRVLSFYERIGFRRTNLYTVTKGLSNCLMLAGIQRPSLQCLRGQGFQVEEAREQGALYPTLLIASAVARQIQTAAQTDVLQTEQERTAQSLVFQGRHVVVRPFLHSDLPLLHHWEQQRDPPGYATHSQLCAWTMAELEATFKQENRDGSVYRFAVESGEGRLIGQVIYRDLEPGTRNVTIEVLIGEPDFWSGEWGKDASSLLVEYLFDRIGVHRISITVSVLQQHLIHDLEALGFQRDGILRDQEIVAGRYVDHILLSILEAK